MALSENYAGKYEYAKVEILTYLLHIYHTSHLFINGSECK